MRTLMSICIPGFIVAGLVLPGCQTTGGPAPQVAQSPGPGEQLESDAVDPPPAAMPHVGVALFGDRPAAEEVPFENRLLANLTRHTFAGEGLDFDPCIDSTGESLVFASTRNSEHPDIYAKHVVGTAVIQITSDPADDIQPRWSPDGERIVFSSNRGGNWDIWVINRDGTGLTRLTSDSDDEIAPCWSPEGTEIAYTRWASRSRRWELWTLSPTEPGVRRFMAYGMFPAWSPDGTKIAFQRARQRGSQWFSVWTIELVDGEARYPTEVAHSDVCACIAPAWSPDGSALAYCAVRRGLGRVESDEAVQAELWAVQLDTGKHTILTGGGGTPAFNPSWSGCGRVFFVSARGGNENIWSLTTDGALLADASEDGPRVSRATINEALKLERE